MKTDPDLAIVSACQTGSKEEFQRAYEELFQRYKNKVYNVAYRITGSDSDAADVAQEAFIVLYKKIQDFRFNSKFSSWLYRIVVNLSIDRRRKNNSKLVMASETIETLQSLDSPELVDRREAAPETVYGHKEFEGYVQSCINQLSPKFSTILVLRYLEDLSYKEIGDILGCSIGTVKSRLSRAHKAIEAVLGPNLEKYRL